jgi:hypothetical protein
MSIKHSLVQTRRCAHKCPVVPMQRKLRVLLSIIVVALGGFHAWNARDYMTAVQEGWRQIADTHYYAYMLPR